MFKRVIFTTIIAVLTISSVNVYAAQKQYTITVRAGSNNAGGSFTDEYAALTGGVLNSDKSAISYTLDKGAALPQLPDSIGDFTGIGDEYYILDKSEWNYRKNKGNTVTRDEEVVVQYGRLLDGVEYTVCFVQKGTDKNIYPAVINRGNKGSVVTGEAKPISGYELIGEKNKTLTLSDSNNEIRFEYEYKGPAAEYTEKNEYEYEDGGTEITYIDNGVVDEGVSDEGETVTETYSETATAGGSRSTASSASQRSGVRGVRAENTDNSEAAGDSEASEPGPSTSDADDVSEDRADDTSLSVTEPSPDNIETTEIINEAVPLSEAAAVEYSEPYMIWVAYGLIVAILVSAAVLIIIKARRSDT